MNSKPDIIVRGEAYNENIAVPITLFLNFPTSDHAPVECGVIFDRDSDITRVMQRNKDNIHTLSVRSHKSHHTDNQIWIPRIRINSGPGQNPDRSYGGIAELSFIGNLDEYKTSPNNLECFAILQDNALMSFVEDKAPISWNCPLGSAELIYEYRYGGYIHDIRERTTKKKNLIHITINATQQESLESLLLNLSDYLDDLMWLISFLCKKYVHWYQLDVYCEPNSGGDQPLILINGYRDPSIVRWNRTRHKHPGFENHPSDLLINLPTLRTEIAEKVFSEFNYNEYSDQITNTIILLMMTFTDSVVEQELSLVYTALELLNSKFGKELLNKHKGLEALVGEFLEVQTEMGVATLRFGFMLPHPA